MILHTLKLKALPYSTSVTIVLCDNINDARKQFELRKSDKSNWDKTYVGITYLNRGPKRDKYEVFLFVNVPKHKTLKDLVDTFAHETVHVLDYIFDGAGVDTDYNNNEPYAYLHGFITGEVFNLYLINQSKDFCVQEGYITLNTN